MGIKDNLLKPDIEVDLLLFKEGLRHIGMSLDRGHITREQAHTQKNKLASIYADHITHLTEQRDEPHRYLVQFCQEGYFTTDCGFRDGQLEHAKDYVRTIVDTLEEMSEGIIFDTRAHGVAYRYAQPEVSDEQVSAVFGERQEHHDPNGSDGIDDDPFVKYSGPDDPEIRYR